MNKELEEVIKRALKTKQRGMCTISVETLETVLQTLKKINDETEAQKFLLQQRDIEILDSISKEKIKEGIESIEDYFERLNGPDEDIEYIRNVKQELLEGK